MADKRITDLPLILSGDISSNDVLPIVDITTDTTNKIEVSQLKSYILSGATNQIITISGGTGILTGGTYPNFTITNTSPDQIVSISGGTNLSVVGTYPNFGINFTGATGGGIFTGGTVTGSTNFTNGLTANTLNVNGVNITGDTYTINGSYQTGGTLTLNYNTGGYFQITGLTEDLNNEIDSLAETDERTITLNTSTNKIELKEIVESATGGTRTFQGNFAISGGTLNLNTIGSGTSIINLGLDSLGFVVTGTTGGSSLYNLPVPNLKIRQTGTTIQSLDTDNSYVGYNEIGSGITFDKGAYVVSNDISEEQITKGVWLEMVLYRRSKKNQNNSKGFVIPPSYSWDGVSGSNPLQDEISTLYSGLTIPNRGGLTLYYNYGLSLSEPLKVSRPNHQKVTGTTQVIDITNYFNGRYTYRNIPYRKEDGNGEITPFKLPIPISMSRRFLFFSRFCYSSNLTPTYAAFRYIMFDEKINNGKGGFISGPLTKTLKVTINTMPFEPTTPYYNIVNGKYYQTCSITSGYTENNKLKFSIESNIP